MSEKWLDNRELSWLKFNLRVLEEAENKKVPLAERLSFIRIFQTNLDEFFRVRIGSLYDQMLYFPNEVDGKSGMNSEQQLAACLKKVRVLTKKRDKIFNNLLAQLSPFGFNIVRYKNLTLKHQKAFSKYFEKEVLPLLSPLVISKRQPFPFMNNEAMYVVAGLLSKKGKNRLGMVSIEHAIEQRLLPVEGMPGSFVLMEDIILSNIGSIFDKHEITSKAVVRVTRNADIDEEDSMLQEWDDDRELMEQLIQLRKKLAPIRLEIAATLEDNQIEMLARFLNLDRNQIFSYTGPVDYGFIGEIRDYLKTLSNDTLFYNKLEPQKSSAVKDRVSMIKQIAKKDILLSYPFESMNPLIRLLNEASEDEKVVSIKMTLYRVAKRSKLVQALMRAAQNGKEVVVLVELRARFDEENNIDWSKKLENAGCRVIYGLEGHKVHSKLCLITYKDEEGVKYVHQVGTGNFNEVTSGIYTDYALLSANQQIGEEINQVFNHLSLRDKENQAEYLMVAPTCMLSRILDKIDEQIALAKEGQEAYLGFKVNGLTDMDVINKLVEASQAGVKIDLIVRSICCLIPGVEGQTENIRVISIVGRYLEHSRIYIFGKGENQEVYISSADLMSRNQKHRVEVATVIMDKDVKKQIMFMFNTMLKDNVKAKELRSDGKYYRVRNKGAKINSQEYFFKKLK